MSALLDENLPHPAVKRKRFFCSFMGKSYPPRGFFAFFFWMWLLTCKPATALSTTPSPLCFDAVDLILGGASAIDPSVQAFRSLQALECLRTGAFSVSPMTGAQENTFALSYALSSLYSSAFIRQSEPYASGEASQADFIDARGPLFEGAGSLALRTPLARQGFFGLGTAPSFQFAPLEAGTLQSDIRLPMMVWFQGQGGKDTFIAPTLLYGTTSSTSLHISRWTPGLSVIVPIHSAQNLWAFRVDAATSWMKARYEADEDTQNFKSLPKEEGALRLEAIHLRRSTMRSPQWLLSAGTFTSRQNRLYIEEDRLKSAPLTQLKIQLRTTIQAHPSEWIAFGVHVHGGTAWMFHSDTNESSPQLSYGTNVWLGMRRGLFQVLGVFDLRKRVEAAPDDAQFEYQVQAKWGIQLAIVPSRK